MFGTMMVFLKYFFETVMEEMNVRQKCMKNYPACLDLILLNSF